MRIYLWYKPTPSPTIKGVRLHHYVYGIVIIPIGFLLESIFIYALDLSMLIDELGWLIIKGKHHKDNYSKKSLFLLLIFIVVVFIFRKDFLLWM